MRTKLNHDKKAVWKENLHLDQKQDGCYASAETLAERLGLTKRQVEDYRREWKAHGFLVSKDRPGYRNNAWFATLPIPLPVEPIPLPTVEQVNAFCDQLEQAMKSPTKSRTSNPHLNVSNVSKTSSSWIPAVGSVLGSVLCSVLFIRDLQDCVGEKKMA